MDIVQALLPMHTLKMVIVEKTCS